MHSSCCCCCCCCCSVLWQIPSRIPASVSESRISSFIRTGIHSLSRPLIHSFTHSVIQSLQREPFCLTAPLLVAHFGLTWLMFAAEPWGTHTETEEKRTNTNAKANTPIGTVIDLSTFWLTYTPKHTHTHTHSK